MSTSVVPMSATRYLRDILARESVDVSLRSPLRGLEGDVTRLCRAWAGPRLVEVYPTGGFEKGTANASGMVIDFIASITPDVADTTRSLYDGLFNMLDQLGYEPVRRDVSVAVMLGDVAVDIVPAKREAITSDVHEIFSRRTGSTVKTNLTQHVLDAISCGRREEIRLIKLWRDQQRLDFPCYYLELAVVAALQRAPAGMLAENVWAVFGYLENLLVGQSFLDAANTGNVVSNQLGRAGKAAISSAAKIARTGPAWEAIIR